jgi:hypothetical protein
VIELLNTLMEQSTAGDPMSAKKWSRKDTRSISRQIKAEGIDICPNSVGKLLKDQDYSLRGNRKTIAETYHPDRNQQFELIAQTRRRFEDEGQPILSVDTKILEELGARVPKMYSHMISAQTQWPLLPPTAFMMFP